MTVLKNDGPVSLNRLTYESTLAYSYRPTACSIYLKVSLKILQIEPCRMIHSWATVSSRVDKIDAEDRILANFDFRMLAANYVRCVEVFSSISSFLFTDPVTQKGIR